MYHVGTLKKKIHSHERKRFSVSCSQERSWWGFRVKVLGVQGGCVYREEVTLNRPLGVCSLYRGQGRETWGEREGKRERQRQRQRLNGRETESSPESASYLNFCTDKGNSEPMWFPRILIHRNCFFLTLAEMSHHALMPTKFIERIFKSTCLASGWVQILAVPGGESWPIVGGQNTHKTRH